MSNEKEIAEIAEIAKVIEITEQVARDAHCGYPSPTMHAKSLYWKGYRKQKEGVWIDKPTGAYSRMQSWCSACGKHSGIGGIESNRHKPYCPNCGAHMKGADNAPTADVVEVVRCKDCKYSQRYAFKTHLVYCRDLHVDRMLNDFCSYGERKDNG